MDTETIKTVFMDFVREHRTWAPFIVAGLAFGESIAVVSLIVPATVLLFGIGALIESGGLAFWPVWAGAAVGAILGDWASFEFGRYFKDSAKTTWPLNKQPHAVARAESFMQRWGAGGVFIGRFFGPIRAFVPLVAGVFRMPRPTFLTVNVASALVWAFFLLSAGDVAGNAAGHLMGRLGF
jgi:membrane protein DedA with SNARE-associated domain